MNTLVNNCSFDGIQTQLRSSKYQQVIRTRKSPGGWVHRHRIPPNKSMSELNTRDQYRQKRRYVIKKRYGIKKQKVEGAPRRGCNFRTAAKHHKGWLHRHNKRSRQLDRYVFNLYDNTFKCLLYRLLCLIFMWPMYIPFVIGKDMFGPIISDTQRFRFICENVFAMKLTITTFNRNDV